MSSDCPKPRGDLIIPPMLVGNVEIPSDIAQTFRVLGGVDAELSLGSSESNRIYRTI